MDEISLTIQSRNAVVLSKKVKSVSSINNKGEFDVTPNHANFISLIKDKITLIPSDGPKEEIGIDNAIMHVMDNKVDVFLGISQS